MEYLGMFVSYWTASVLTTRLILRNADVFNLGQTVAQAGLIIVATVVVTVIFHIVRTLRTCTLKKDEKRTSYGISKGLGLAFYASVFVVIAFALTNIAGVGQSIITAFLPFLADYIEFFRGLAVAMAGITGYGIGRIFISLC